MQLQRLTLFGALLATALWNGGCSLLFHADPAQCSKDSDCTARGTVFANSICQQSTCVSRSGVDGGAGADGGPSGTGGSSGGRGGSGSVGAGGDVSPVWDASEPSDVSQEAGNPAADAALESGGDSSSGADAPTEAAAPPCTSNADCPYADPNHREVACDIGSGTCLQLTTDECPFVEGDYSGATFPPIYLGAFSSFPPNGPQTYPSYLNYALAIKEFGTGGIPGWDGKHSSVGYRMPVAIICNAEERIPAAMAHLTGSLRVRAIVTQFDSLTLKKTFLDDESRAFFVNPFSANSTLTILPTDGRLWHMLGQPSDHAPAYAAFMPRLEAYVRSLRALSPSDPVRLATVTGNATDTQDLAAAVLKILQWNSKTLEQNQNESNYVNVTIDSVLNGVDPASIQIDSAVSTLLAFKPHIILSFGAYEFTKLLPIYEAQNTAGPAPFYLLGPYNMVSSTITTWVGNGTGSATEAKRKRLAGIGTASTTYTDALTHYKTRFLGLYGTSAESALGNENYYDAMYFAIYSLAFASRVSSPTGDNLAEGMPHLISGQAYEMGPGDMSKVLGALGSLGSISLMGALGPPNFTRTTGARQGEGSVYCLTSNGAGTPTYTYDVLRAAPAADGGVPTLTGSFSCYSGL